MTVSNEAIRAGEMAALGRYLNKETVRLILEAAAPLVAAQAAKDEAALALESAADYFATRSQSFLNTMQGMVGNAEYGNADIIRYGAYSAEAQSAANRLTARAAALRGQG